MQVILRTDVEKLGLRGEVVEVAPGFARNFLIPRKLAQRATPALVAELEKREAQRSRHEARDFDQGREIAERLEAAELRFDVQAGETGTLFGSVTATNVADELWSKLKIRVDRRKIGLSESIKRIGRYEIPVEVFADVTATLRIAVVPEGGELPPQEELDAQVAAEEAALAATAAQDAELSDVEAIEPTAEEVAGEVPADDFDRVVDAAVETPDEAAGDESDPRAESPPEIGGDTDAGADPHAE
jgi:large subunit ribosomal protein L9